MYKGKHLLVDCREVPRDLCLNDQLLLESLAAAATEAGSTVISQVRYKFGQDSPPGCTAIVMLDESHCSVHTYADLGLMAFDFFTCGHTDPKRIWSIISSKLGIVNATVTEHGRFEVPAEAAAADGEFAQRTLSHR
ncbi:adenosylmethionine decarboxylase [bacterium]|nr:adenosylmethionine decarboxylase [bacterium]